MALTVSQVNYKDNSSWTSLIDMVYPKGSIFLGYNLMNKNDTTSAHHPGKLFGGSWLPIENKMLRSGWGNATGGNDKHCHTYGALIRGYYGAAIGGWNPDDLLTLASPSAADSTHDIYFGNVYCYGYDGVGSRNNALTNSYTRSDSGFVYQRILSTTGKNVKYAAPTKLGNTTIEQKLDDAKLLAYGKSIESSNTTMIPAYQTVNTWYRTN
jgi:hypothetical protein